MNLICCLRAYLIDESKSMDGLGRTPLVRGRVRNANKNGLLRMFDKDWYVSLDQRSSITIINEGHFVMYPGQPG